MSPAIRIDKFIANHATILIKETKICENRSLKKRENP